MLVLERHGVWRHPLVDNIKDLLNLDIRPTYVLSSLLMCSVRPCRGNCLYSCGSRNNTFRERDGELEDDAAERDHPAERRFAALQESQL